MTVNAANSAFQTAAGEVRVFRDLEDLSRAAAYLFTDLASRAARDRGTFSAALSGGSTPKQLYSLLAQPEFAKHVPWSDIHLFWGDERCVPPDHPESNYGMVREVLLKRISIPASNVHRIRGEIDPEQAAIEYEAVLRQFFAIGPKELPRFDLVLLGLGEDGHTASLFPDSAALDERERLVAALYVERLHAYRVTLTLPVLNHAAAIAFLVAGERKRSAVYRAVHKPDEMRLLPAQRVRPVEGRLLWFLDLAAAADLSR